MNGKNYDATRDADGALVIHRVPIFVECSRNEVQFDRSWIEKAVAKAAQAAKEGYYPPLHVRHHEATTDANDSVRAAGFFRIVGAEQITFKGAPRLAVLADLVVTDPAVQAEILGKRLPYRSVEIFDVEKPSIDSLALLDHEAPFLELPMLTVKQTQQIGTQTQLRARGPVDYTPRDRTVCASFRRGPVAALLFREELMAAEDTKDDKKGEKMEGAPLDVGALVKAIESGSISVADMEAIVAAIAAQQGGAEVEVEAEEPEVAAEAVKGDEPEAKMADDGYEDDKKKKAPADTPSGAAMSLMATLQGQNEALFARIRRMEQDQERAQDVVQALKRLDGKPLGSDLESRLVSFHAEHGRKAFAAYVEAMDSTVGLVERSTANSDAFRAQATSVPAVALKYQGDGVEAVDRAAKFAREWEYLHKTGHTRIPQDRYVAVNMARTNTEN